MCGVRCKSVRNVYEIPKTINFPMYGLEEKEGYG